MKALVWHAPEDVRVEERPIPLVGGPGDAVIRVVRAAICGSDLHTYHGSIPGMRNGDVLGHEFMGIVEEIGPGVKTLQPGDRVVVAAVIACGACFFCESKLFSLCETTNPNPVMQLMYGHHIAGGFGYTHLAGGYDGGQAEYVRVPYADVGCLKLPDDVTDDQAVLLSDAACTGWMAADIGEVRPGSTVAVWGAGPIGLSALTAARAMGAQRLIVIDNVPHRLKLARERLGAEAINFDEDRPVMALHELTHGRGPDVCIEAAGFRYAKSIVHKVERALKLETDAIDALSEVIRAVRKGGNIAIMGDFIGYTNHFPIGALMEKGITVRSGQVHVQRYWRDILEKMRTGAYDPSFIITHRLPLEQASEAYRIFDKKEDGVIKVVLSPGGAGGAAAQPS
jgi:threonine dehydrogenase-like Zn-dependent dehydrogenase